MNNDKFVLRNVWISSWVLSFSLLGDALLYLVLPVNAEAFGVSMAMVGLLLSINRIVRTFTYGMVVRFALRIGLRNTAIIGSITALLSTLGYALFEGGGALVLSRVLWGLSYAALLLVTLSYASINPAATGTRIGISRSVEQVGPLFATIGGAALAGMVGPTSVFYYMALGSTVGLGLALLLHRQVVVPASEKPAKRGFAIPRPTSVDVLIFWMGFGIDGVFTVTIALMWLAYVDPATAIIFGGSILAARRVCEMVIAPVAGNLADRYGVRMPLVAVIMLCCLGFLLIGFGYLLSGSALLVLCRGALGTLFPAAVARLHSDQPVVALARNQTWRDIGAAAGPLLTGLLISVISPEWLHVVIGVLFVASFGGFVMGASWARLR